MKAAEITFLSPAGSMASSFEKKPKPLKEAVCPDFAGLFAGGDDALPMVFHRGPPAPGALPTGSVEASSFLVSGLVRLGLAS